MVVFGGLAFWRVQVAAGPFNPGNSDLQPLSVEVSGHELIASPQEGYLAVVLADELERIVSPFDATVETLAVREGANVTLGQTLVRLRATQLDHEIRMAQADLASARVTVEEAELYQTQAAEKLARMKAVSEIYAESDRRDAELDLERHDRRVESAKMAVNQVLIRLATYEERAAKEVLKAPFDGTVRSLQLVQGQRVAEGQDLMTLIAPAQGAVRFAVPPGQVGAIETGSPIRMWNDATSHSYLGSVTSVTPQRDEPSQMIFCLAQLQFDGGSNPPAGSSGMVTIAGNSSDEQ